MKALDTHVERNDGPEGAFRQAIASIFGQGSTRR